MVIAGLKGLTDSIMIECPAPVIRTECRVNVQHFRNAIGYETSLHQAVQTAVPPIVIPLIRKCGSPTPTGTL